MKGKSMAGAIGMTAVWLIITGTVLYAFDPAHVQQLKSTKQCEGCDLNGADLSELFLRWANPSRSNLSNANLSRAKMFQADLSNGNLSKANLSWAFLSQANLSRSNLNNANLSNANLSRADLRGANLAGADLRHADLSKADLREAIWTDGRKCNLHSIGKCYKGK